MAFKQLTQDDLDSRDTITIFKHSDRCGISQDRKQAIEDWLASHDATVFEVEVRDQRSLSDTVAETTGVSHESPQLIVIKDGEVTHHSSHMSIEPDSIPTDT